MREIKKKQVFLSVIIPCYNEEANLKRGVLDQVSEYLKKQKFNYEVLISDDGSSDNSLKLVQKFVKKHKNFKVLKNKHGGKPRAIWQGIKVSKGKWVLFVDMDQSTPISEFNKLLPYFKKNYDVVIGSRGLAREGFSLIRQIASKVFRYLRGIFVLWEIEDTQCGFKALKRKIALEVFPKLQFFQGKQNISGWRVSAFDVELLFIAKKSGYRIKEVVVKWQDEDVSEDKDRRFIKESRKMAREVLRVRINDLRGKYDKVGN